MAHLAFLLPGRNYPAVGAALHVPRLTLDQLGATTVVADYGGRTGSSKQDDTHRMEAVQSQLAAALAEHDPERVTFVAKSLGAGILAALTLPLGPRRVDAIWVTPALGDQTVESGVIAKAWRSLLVEGSADPWFDAAAHERVRQAIGAKSLIIDRADHGLDIDLDIRATLAGWNDLANAVVAFASD